MVRLTMSGHHRTGRLLSHRPRTKTSEVQFQDHQNSHRIDQGLHLVWRTILDIKINEVFFRIPKNYPVRKNPVRCMFVRILSISILSFSILSGVRILSGFSKKLCPLSVCPAGQGQDRAGRTIAVLGRRRLK